MFEAKLTQGAQLKKIIESIRDLVTDANLDCSESGIQMQAMDSSHVSLCALTLRSDGFEHYRCDQSFSMGVNTPNLGKILKCAGNDDSITLKHSEESVDSVSMEFVSPSEDRVSEFELKLMDIDSEHLGIPDTEYKCNVRLPSSELQRIIRDLQVLGDACTIAVTKEGIKFSSEGDLGTGSIMLKHNVAVDKEDESVVVDMQEPVELNFALRYLNMFTKATALGPTVTLSMSPDVPLVVEYPIGELGHVRYYLAPKIDDEYAE
jgi:proliferating cell nuclear antigen